MPLRLFSALSAVRLFVPGVFLSELKPLVFQLPKLQAICPSVSEILFLPTSCQLH